MHQKTLESEEQEEGGETKQQAKETQSEAQTESTQKKHIC
jgi:hypothetical protein